MNTILITGTSSGIGNAVAHLFAEHGWQVFAGSRQPDPKHYRHQNIIPVTLDVNDGKSVEAAFLEIDRHGPLDCVVNNAGMGLVRPLEDTSSAEIDAMFRCNVFGLMEVCRQAIRRMRKRGSGTIVNVSSVAGQIGIPLYSAYTATKWAVEGVSESLRHELMPFGIRMKVVEPGAVRTPFFPQAYGNDPASVTDAYRERYAEDQRDNERRRDRYQSPEAVAAVIFRAATDPSDRLRYQVGSARTAVLLKKLLPEGIFLRLMERRMR